jgi:hypothetical protein
MLLSRTSTIRQIPVLLCQLLSPGMADHETESILQYLIKNPSLLDAVVACANQHMVITTLYAQLHSKHQLQLLPKNLLDYMQAMYHWQRIRNQRIRQQASAGIRILNENGIRPLLLKGLDTLFYDLYPATGARFMIDVDILIAAADIRKAQAVMLQHGYEIPEEYRGIKQNKQAHHLLPLYKKGHDFTVELHVKPLNKNCGDLLTAYAAFKASQILHTHYRDLRIDADTLSPEHKIIHAFAHSEISHDNKRHDKLDIRQMDYFVRLVTYYEQFDRDKIERTLAAHGLSQEFQVYCYKARHLFSAPIEKITIQADNLPVQRTLHRRYHNTLKSAALAYYPWRRYYLGISQLLALFGRTRLGREYEVTTWAQYIAAIFMQAKKQLQDMLHSPTESIRKIKCLFMIRED